MKFIKKNLIETSEILEKIGKFKNQYQIQNVKPNIFDSTTKSIIKDI